MTIDFIMDLEAGVPMSREHFLTNIADGIASGLIWRLQGAYDRMARSIIEEGYVTPDGTITDAGQEWIDEAD